MKKMLALFVIFVLLLCGVACTKEPSPETENADVSSQTGVGQISETSDLPCGNQDVLAFYTVEEFVTFHGLAEKKDPGVSAYLPENGNFDGEYAAKFYCENVISAKTPYLPDPQDFVFDRILLHMNFMDLFLSYKNGDGSTIDFSYALMGGAACNTEGAVAGEVRLKNGDSVTLYQDFYSDTVFSGVYEAGENSYEIRITHATLDQARAMVESLQGKIDFITYGDLAKEIA